MEPDEVQHNFHILPLAQLKIKKGQWPAGEVSAGSRIYLYCMSISRLPLLAFLCGSCRELFMTGRRFCVACYLLPAIRFSPAVQQFDFWRPLSLFVWPLLYCSTKVVHCAVVYSICKVPQCALSLKSFFFRD